MRSPRGYLAPIQRLHEGLPVTVIVAMRESEDSVLIGADSEVTQEGGLRRTSPKLAGIKGVPIAWGASGNPSIGIHQFREWMRTYKWENATWSEFVDEAETELARLNGIQRRLTEESGAELKPNFLSDVLVVGWLRGKVAIWVLSDDGRRTPAKDVGFYAIGSGGPTATSVHNALIVLRDQYNLALPTAQQNMETILHVTALTAPGCNWPVHCWRVKPTGVEGAFKFSARVDKSVDSAADIDEQSV